MGAPSRSCSFWLACYLTAGGCIAAEVNADIRDVVDQAKEARSQEIAAADEVFAKAEEQFKAGEYSKADALFREAIGMINALQGALAEHRQQEYLQRQDELKRVWSDSVMEEAKRLASEDKFVEAINQANYAVSIDDRKRDSVQEFVTECRAQQQSQAFTAATTLEAADPAYEADRKEIDALFRQAMTCYQLKQYDKAREMFEKIYSYDPYYAPAIEVMSRMANELYTAGLLRHKAEAYNMMAMNSWEWVVETLPGAVTAKDMAEKAIVKEASDVAMMRRLDSIIFDNLEFDGESPYAVISSLSRLSKSADPEGVGVDIVPAFSESLNEELAKFTMSVRNLSLLDAIRYLCHNTGLKFKIEGDSVVIGDNISEMKMQYFPIRTSIINDIAEAMTPYGYGGPKNVGIFGGIFGPNPDTLIRSNYNMLAGNNTAFLGSTGNMGGTQGGAMGGMGMGAMRGNTMGGMGGMGGMY